MSIVQEVGCQYSGAGCPVFLMGGAGPNPADGSVGSGDVRRVSSEMDLRCLGVEILSAYRSYPIICLTVRPGQKTPLSVSRVRGIAGPRVPIYLVVSTPLVERLRQYLPEHLCPKPGLGRIWWPGVDRDSNPTDHPLLYDPDVRGEEAYARLIGEFGGPESSDLPIGGSPGVSCEQEERSKEGRHGGGEAHRQGRAERAREKRSLRPGGRLFSCRVRREGRP